MNSLRSAWTPFLASPHSPQIPAKAGPNTDLLVRFAQGYTLSDWHKIPFGNLA
jgi:hypothetical protein